MWLKSRKNDLISRNYDLLNLVITTSHLVITTFYRNYDFLSHKNDFLSRCYDFLNLVITTLNLVITTFNFFFFGSLYLTLLGPFVQKYVLTQISSNSNEMPSNTIISKAVLQSIKHKLSHHFSYEIYVPNKDLRINILSDALAVAEIVPIQLKTPNKQS